ncbi:MAG TPA: histidine kinase [Acidimicrobiia bacterium]|nr:histidine kinase [Acidimicrobiia bacterium]
MASTKIDSAEPAAALEITSLRGPVGERPRGPRRVPGVAAVGVVATGVAIAGAAAASDGTVGPGRVLVCVLVAGWAAAAVVVARQRPHEQLSWVMAAGATIGAVAVIAAAQTGKTHPGAGSYDAKAAILAVAVALLPAAGLHLALSLPRGTLEHRARRALTALGYAGSVGLGASLYAQRPGVPLAPLALAGGVAASVGLVGYVRRCQAAGTGQERARLQWVAWGVVVAAAITVGAAVLNTLVAWPHPVAAVAAGSTLLVPFSLAVGASEQLAVRIDRLLVHSITLAGLVGLVGASYLLIVFGLGHAPSRSEKSLLGLSMLAAAVAALLWVPARERLTDLATRRVYGEGHAPDEVLRTFGSRLTRALPLDELLLQLAESLKATMNLEVAEVWTRSGQGIDRAVSVPDRGPATIPLGPEEETVVAHAGVSGPAWAQVWLPAILVGLEEPVLRTAPVTNSGELLGLIVVRRAQGALPFNEADDLALTELARQVGLALHNVKLDSALQESLDAVRRQADELRASRARIVQATDTERRRIERDLHDGAQQHLVALAVGVRLVRQIADTDPEQAKTMLDQIGLDLQDAVQELRNLAHGIYPPLLMDRGLPDALRAAAGRAALLTTVEADGIGRYPQQVEAAVYFCCLEALQNAGKHAGAGAEATVTLREVEGALVFEVADTGAGFALESGALHGHGFVNMSDRVGAFGGSVSVDSAPGKGTRIAGRIPLGD